jgi:hypothetical protein
MSQIIDLDHIHLTDDDVKWIEDSDRHRALLESWVRAISYLLSGDESKLL